MLPEQILNPADGVIVDNRLVAVGTVENRNRHAPGSLTGNAPVAAVGHHVVNPVMAPGWEEFYFVNFI